MKLQLLAETDRIPITPDHRMDQEDEEIVLKQVPLKAAKIIASMFTF